MIENMGIFSSEKKQQWNLIPSQMSGQLGSWILNLSIVFSYSTSDAAAGIGMQKLVCDPVLDIMNFRVECCLRDERLQE